jgi:DNA-directed RNA polymerase omega subunit
MDKTEETINNVANNYATDGELQEIDSNFRLIVIAALRNKQLQKGARPRIETDSHRRRNTNIAIEESKRGLVHFKLTDDDGIAIAVRT